METTLFAIVCDLRFAIRDRLRSYGNQPKADKVTGMLVQPCNQTVNELVLCSLIGGSREVFFVLVMFCGLLRRRKGPKKEYKEVNTEFKRKKYISNPS